eukprot:6213436-Pleurochrysis_carterae.AAC.7
MSMKRNGESGRAREREGRMGARGRLRGTSERSGDLLQRRQYAVRVAAARTTPETHYVIERADADRCA